MADEGEVDVVLTDEAGDEGKDKGAQKEAVVAKNDEPTLAEQLEQLKQERDKERELRLAAEREAREAGGRVAKSEEEIRKSHITTMSSALEVLAQQKNQLKAAYAAAAAEGDFEKQADISAELAQNAADANDIKRGKLMAETVPPMRQPVRQSGDPAVEAVAATVTPASADWFRAHPEYAKNPRLLNKVKAAHYKVVAEIGEELAETPEYFKAVEAELGIGTPKSNGDAAGDHGVDVTLSEASKAAQKRDAVQPSPAPASRGGANARTVRLTPDQQAAAKMSGLTNEEYARNMLAEKAKGNIH